MSNEYKDEFDALVKLWDFKYWTNENLENFCYNFRNIEKEKKPLREWIRLFLLWSEYEDNKDGN